MKIRFSAVVVSAGLAGILSFSFLALAIGSEYWYIIDDNRPNYTEDSHSGLWRTYEGKAAAKLICQKKNVELEELGPVKHMFKLFV